MKHARHFGIIVLLVLIAPSFASAELGGNAKSVHTDQIQMKSGVMPGNATSPSYSVQQIQSGNGTTIKEFISSTGTVFAVTWQGPLMPDMQQLLGQYFSDYVNAAKNDHGGHHRLNIKQAGLVCNPVGVCARFLVSPIYPA